MEAIVRQTNGAFLVIPSTPAGIITAAQLAKISELAAQGAGLVKLTAGQRVAIVTTEDQLEQVRQGLAEVGLKIGPVGDVVRNVKACPGDLCGFSVQDSLKHGLETDQQFSGMETPYPFKISFSGCSRSCMEARCQDIGFVGTIMGYDMYIGGKGGGVPVHGTLFAKDLDPEQVVPVIDQVLKVFKENAQDREKLNSVIERIGIDAFRLA